MTSSLSGSVGGCSIAASHHSTIAYDHVLGGFTQNPLGVNQNVGWFSLICAFLGIYDARMSKSMQYRIALIAHDSKKADIVVLAHDFKGFMSTCKLCATGTTGGRIIKETGLKVERLLSGPLGGDLQIGARLASGKIDAVIFLRDPMTPQPHEPDINALVRACDVHNVPCATNVATAQLLLQSLMVVSGS
jgi:methylglyoxal synthase